MLNLLTATPGSGKTLLLVLMMMQEKERPIYYFNINLTELGKETLSNWTELTEPVDWPEHVPDGSIVIIDEVQQIFPTRSPRDPVPASVKALETHRHHGWDIYFVTQMPSLLDHHARALVGRHIHLQRNYGMARSTMYDSNALMDIKNYHDLKKANKTLFNFPTKVYPLYKSAEVHTHKRRLPKKLLLIPALIGLVGIAFYMLYATMFSDDSFSSKIINQEQQGFDPLAGGITSGGGMGRRSATITPASFKPSIIGLPGSAPIYAHLFKAKVAPRPQCLANAKRDRCQCYTQQASLLDIPLDICLAYVDHGYFDFTQDNKTQNSGRRGAGAAAPRPRSTPTKRYVPTPEPVTRSVSATFAPGYRSRTDYTGNNYR